VNIRVLEPFHDIVHLYLREIPGDSITCCIIVVTFINGNWIVGSGSWVVIVL
jgi:hypothetical protein